MTNHEAHNDEEEQSFKALSQFKNVRSVSQNLTLLFNYPDNSDQLSELDKFIHSAQSSNTYNLIGIFRGIRLFLLGLICSRRLAKPSEWKNC